VEFLVSPRMELFSSPSFDLERGREVFL
jgi:hypothetical protein